MEVIRAVLTAVGLVVVLLLAAVVVGLAVAILAVMVMQGVEGERPVPAPVPPRRTVPAIPAMDTTPMAARESPAIPGKETKVEPIPGTAESRRGDRRKIRP